MRSALAWIFDLSRLSVISQADLTRVSPIIPLESRLNMYDALVLP